MPRSSPYRILLTDDERHHLEAAACRTHLNIATRTRLAHAGRARVPPRRGPAKVLTPNDFRVPSTIDADVRDGFVTLTGTAGSQFERDGAEFVAGNVRAPPG